MKATGEDRELLLSFALLPAAPEAAATPVPGALVTPIKPLRSLPALDRTDDCKVTYSFKRQVPADAAKGYSFVNLSPGNADVVR